MKNLNITDMKQINATLIVAILTVITFLSVFLPARQVVPGSIVAGFIAILTFGASIYIFIETTVYDRRIAFFVPRVGFAIAAGLATASIAFALASIVSAIANQSEIANIVAFSLSTCVIIIAAWYIIGYYFKENGLPKIWIALPLVGEFLIVFLAVFLSSLFF